MPTEPAVWKPAKTKPTRERAPVLIRDDGPHPTHDPRPGGETNGAVTGAVTRGGPPPPVSSGGMNSGGRLLDRLDSARRKEYPITTGVLDYFPDAITEIAHVSYLGNLKHNPGQPLHWARGKSTDHEDCISRHTIQRDTVEDNVLHAANRAWRALAELQMMLEAKHNLDPPRGAK